MAKIYICPKTGNLTVKNIILDLGGVLLPLDIAATSAAFKKLGAQSFETIYTQLKQDYFFDLFDKGIISENEFRHNLKPALKPDVTDKEIDSAWNAMLGLIPSSRIDFIKNLKQQFNLILLSNTNSIHVSEFLKHHNSTYGPGIFNQLFHHVIFSCDTGMRKPDEEIFNHALHVSSAIHEETIFIDDTIHHVEGARKAGIKSYHLNTAETSVEALLQEVLAGSGK